MEEPQVSIRDPYDTGPYVKRMLEVLEKMIRERGYTQKRIQEELGWGRAYISHMQNQHKELQVDPLLKILMVIGVEPHHYFAIVFAEPPEAEKKDPVAAELLKKTTVTDERLFGLIQLLRTKDVVAANEAAELLGKPAAAGDPAPKRRRRQAK